MSRRRIVSLAIVAAVALPLIVGCQFLVFKICVKNNTDFYLDEFAVKASSDLTYPPGVISDLAPGDSGSAGGYNAGTYDLRAIFDVSDSEVCEDTVELSSVEIQNTNVCVTYDVQSIAVKSCGQEIYATVDYVFLYENGLRQGPGPFSRTFRPVVFLAEPARKLLWFRDP